MPAAIVSLSNFYPRRRTVLALLCAAAVALALGLVRPVLRVEKFIFWLRALRAARTGSVAPVIEAAV